MSIFKTQAILDRVKQAEPAEAAGPAIPAGCYRARIIDAKEARTGSGDVYTRLELFEFNDFECKGKSIKKLTKVFKLTGEYSEQESGDFMTLLIAIGQDGKLDSLEYKDLVGQCLIVGLETLGRKDEYGQTSSSFNVIARGGFWSAELDHIEFEPRDVEAQSRPRGNRRL